MPNPESQTRSEKAWSALLQRLSEASRTITGPNGATTETDRAEGFRYLTRLVSAGLDMYLEKADPSRPAFTRMMSPTRKFLGDNPDTLYDFVHLDGSLEYQIHGTRGSETYLAFCVYGKNADGATRIVANLRDDEMKFEKDGSFIIQLGGTKPSSEGNWIDLSTDTYAMIIRQYFLDRTTQTEATYEIQMQNPPPAPKPFSEEELEKRLQAVGDFVCETSELSAILSIFSALNPVTFSTKEEAEGAIQVINGEIQIDDDASEAQKKVATIDPKIVAGHLPTPDIQYAGAWYRIEKGEAVVIEGPAPKARYWAAQIFNRWFESPDYQYHRVSINSGQAQLETDGTLKIILSESDPGHPNWLETAGHPFGNLVFRALVSEGPLELKFRKVKLEELSSN